jgi:hypothetical protein
VQSCDVIYTQSGCVSLRALCTALSVAQISEWTRLTLLAFWYPHIKVGLDFMASPGTQAGRYRTA